MLEYPGAKKKIRLKTNSIEFYHLAVPRNCGQFCAVAEMGKSYCLKRVILQMQLVCCAVCCADAQSFLESR